MTKERIKLEMTTKDMLIAICGGNPGSLTACMSILTSAPNIDPDNMMGGLGAILHLDSLNIWDERIYMLWNDVCYRDTAKMLALLRANQLGGLAGATQNNLNHAIDNRGDGIDLEAVMQAVKQRLPRFNRDSEEKSVTA